MRRVCPLGVSLLLSISLPGVRAYAATFEEIAADANAARDAHDVPRAIELYRSAVALRSDWQAGWWFLGMLLYSSGKYADAQDAVQHLTDLNPAAGLGWGLLGLCESENGNYIAALTHVQKALALDAGRQPPGFGDVLRSREAMLLTRNGRFDKALEKYTQFLHGGAASEPLLAALGLAALRRPLMPEEIPASQQALVLAAGKASFAMISGDAASAGQSLRALVESFPSETGVHYLYASWLINRDEPLATSELKRELDIAPYSAAANQMLSWVLLNHGDYSSALAQAQAAVEADPESPVAELVRGRVLEETGHVKDGIAHLEKSVSLDPTNLEARISLAVAYAQAGMYQDATRARREALKLKEAAHVAPN